MSEVLGRTWALLMSSGTGPRWTVPSNQVSEILTDFYNMSLFIILVIVDGITRCDRNNYFLYSRLRRHIYLTAWLNS